MMKPTPYFYKLNYMRPEEFKYQWESLNKNREILNPLLINYSYEDLKDININSLTKEFLIDSGLPKSTAPFLFFDPSPTKKIKSLKEELNLKKNNFINYYIIGGSDGSDICVNSDKNDQIELLYFSEVMDFEVGYRSEISSLIVNNSINKLAESILLYNSVKIENREKSYLSEEEKSEIIMKLRTLMRNIDSKSFDEDGFWNIETEKAYFF